MKQKIYVSPDNHCHVTNPGGAFREVETNFFNGKCADFIEGHCYDDTHGYAAIYPWKPSNELEAAQAQYEVTLAEMDAAYREGVNSV